MKYADLLKESKSKKEIFTHVRPLCNSMSFYCKVQKKDFLFSIEQSLRLHGNVESGLVIDKDGFVGYVLSN